MSIKWIPFPRMGTTVALGKWLCTVETGHTLDVEILELDQNSWNGGGAWFRSGGERLTKREKVIGIAYVPEPMVTA